MCQTSVSFVSGKRFFLRVGIAFLLVVLGSMFVTGAENTDDARRAAQLVRDYRDGLVLIEGQAGEGSGFIVRIKERICLLSNAHVVAGIKNPVFKLLDRTPVKVGAGSVAVGHDIFALSVVAGGTPIPKVDSVDKETAIGDPVVVLGNAEGAGVINTLTGKLVGIGPDRIEVDAPFVPGNSGSPIIHLPSGKVIGIATYLIMKRTGPKEEVVRRFGYRLDSVTQWQLIEWNRFFAESDAVKGVEKTTHELIQLLGGFGRDAAAFPYETPAIRNALAKFTASGRRPKDLEGFLTALRSTCVGDVRRAEGLLTYDFFKRQLATERSERESIASSLDKAIKN